MIIKELNPFEVDRIIEMAWEDRTPFDAIDFQFKLKEKEDSLRSQYEELLQKMEE